MSGPVGMTLGGFPFESLGFGYETVGRRLNTQWADVPVAQGLDQQQWTGPTSEEVTIRGVLFPVEYGGQASLEGIIAAANAGTPLMLVSGSNVQGIIHGLFTVQSIIELDIQRDDGYLVADGRWWWDELAMSFRDDNGTATWRLNRLQPFTPTVVL